MNKWRKIVFEENGCKGKTFDSQEEMTNSERAEKLDCILNDCKIDFPVVIKIEIVSEYDIGSGGTGSESNNWEYINI